MYTENFSITGATGTWIRQGKIRVIRYDSGAATGNVTPTIRVRSLLGSKFDVELTPGRTVTLTEASDGLLVSNASTGADITGKLTFGDGTVADDAVVGAVDLNAATLTALESVDLNAATLNALRYPLEHTASFSDAAVAAANTAQTIFAPAANPNGVILLNAHARDRTTLDSIIKFICHTAAPTTVHQGVTVAQGVGDWITPAGSNEAISVNLPAPVFIPAGSGLYFISNNASSLAATFKSARWRAL